ncbi:xaa-Pro dipeptidyl-peptidase [Streptococcus sanguinis SK1059]|nr:xaa-Pro dipeptidyl-peptidase [Streptococcus sanguinis SK1059]
MRFNQYSYARTKRENMLTELAELGFFMTAIALIRKILKIFSAPAFSLIKIQIIH